MTRDQKNIALLALRNAWVDNQTTAQKTRNEKAYANNMDNMRGLEEAMRIIEGAPEDAE